jgi:hypothetical protein
VSNSLAIAAVTATLQSILQTGITASPNLADTTVTILPLDKARGSNTANQVNLFLYMVNRNAAFINSPMPGQLKPGEAGRPPLALNLYYLLTAFGRDDDTVEPSGHELLGFAMTILHDYPLLQPPDIKAATGAVLPNADLDLQPERVRLTFHPLTIDELSKLWTGFAMQYRLSAGYEVAVTLLESQRANATPLPVLTRGQGDSGVVSQPDLSPTVPTLSALTLPDSQEGARLGDKIKASGVKLAGSGVTLHLQHSLLAGPFPIAPDTESDTMVVFTLPDAAADIPAGLCGLWLSVQRDGESFVRSTNTLPLMVAPRLTLAPTSAPGGAATFTATIAPEVRPGQRVRLLLGDGEIAPDAFATQVGRLTFHADSLPVGDYWARLRVDGVDSLLVDRSKTPPAFDPGQKVTLT